jgi:teichuronic acid biosynthesis glycosyltransferase TuaC
VHSFPREVELGGIWMYGLARELEGRGVEVRFVHTGVLRSPRAFGRAVARLREEVRGCDLVHAQYGSGCGWVASRLPGPRVVTLRGSDWYSLSGGSLPGRLHGFAAHLFTRSALPRYDAVVAVSGRMKDEVEARTGISGVEVVPSAIDLDEFRPMDRARARAALGEADDGSPWILFSSVLSDHAVKRGPLARAAVERLQRRMPGVKLKVMTGVPRALVPAFVNACDAVLLTSEHEGWPNIVKEGLACNVPFVSTDVSNLREIAAVEPTCAVAHPDPDALAGALERLLAQPRPADLRRHVAGMSVERTADRVVELYSRLLDRAVPRPSSSTLARAV